MNYDGLAVVIDYSKNDFKSVDGYCDITLPNPIQDTSEGYYDESQITDNNIYYKNKTFVSDSYVTSETYGITPFTGNITTPKNTTDFHSITVFSYLNNQDKQYNINYEKTIPVSIIARTNIITKRFDANVIDKRLSERIIEFPNVTVDVTDKTQIVIPDNTEVTGLSLVLQKNSFVELELQKMPFGISGIPDGLTWNRQYISGTITKSGSYTMNITYSDGEQILNIIVPYYQRLL